MYSNSAPSGCTEPAHAGVAHLVDLINGFSADESGATALEYVLIASLISVAIIVSAKAVGINIAAMMQNVANQI